MPTGLRTLRLSARKVLSHLDSERPSLSGLDADFLRARPAAQGQDGTGSGPFLHLVGRHSPIDRELTLVTARGNRNEDRLCT